MGGIQVNFQGKYEIAKEGHLLKESWALKKMKRRYVGLFFWSKPARLILNTYEGDSLGPKCT